nr:uncharacterized protein LOC111423758 [Onthophagus taurus]
MYGIIVIREYKTSDISNINQVIRNAYLSSAFNAWLTFLGKEITFQMIVLGAAVMFIFMGVPFQYCIISIPVVMFVMFIFVYLAFLMKAMELSHGKRFNQCWVAESLDPILELNPPKNKLYRIIPEYKLGDEGIDLSRFRKTIVGTVSITKFSHDENAAWLFRLAVINGFRRKGVGQNLVQTAEKWCSDNRFHTIMCSMSECQENARKLFMNNRYLLKHMYHKQIIGSALTLLMYQLESPLITTFS